MKLQDDTWWPFSALFGDLLSFFVPHNFFKRLTLHGNSRISKFCVLYANIVKSFKNNLDVNWSGFSTRKKIGTKRPAAAKVPLFLNKLNNWVFCQRVDFVPKTVRSRPCFSSLGLFSLKWQITWKYLRALGVNKHLNWIGIQKQ